MYLFDSKANFFTNGSPNRFVCLPKIIMQKKGYSAIIFVGSWDSLRKTLVNEFAIA